MCKMENFIETTLPQLGLWSRLYPPLSGQLQIRIGPLLGDGPWFEKGERVDKWTYRRQQKEQELPCPSLSSDSVTERWA